jgi:hypothetical protein
VYQQIITFGVSLGGLPALRAGRLLKATRAISVGGRYPWHPGRLVREERSVQAFDPLCACASPSPTELVVVYSRHNEEDRSAFNLVRKTFPECIAAPIDTEKHNLMGYFYRANLLPLFLACLFDHWDAAAIRTDLLKTLNQAAWQNKFLKSPPVAHSARAISDGVVNRRLVRLGRWVKQLWRAGLR